jgi:sigma-B regulation protein RsbU (phosphoserine phosphatase)
MGFETNTLVNRKKFRIGAGDRLLLYTDGLVECHGPNGRQWGSHSLTKMLRRSTDQNAEQLLTKIMSLMDAHCAGEPLPDDVTLLIAEISPTWTAARAVGEDAA